MESPALKHVDAVTWAIQDSASYHKQKIDLRTARLWARTLWKAALAHSVPIPLIVAVIEAESSWVIDATSSVACQGLMQLHPDTAEGLAKALGIKDLDLNNPEHSIRLGTAYLGQLYRQFGTWGGALTAFNKGPGAFKRNRVISLYARKVMLKSHFVQATINSGVP